MAKQPIDFLFSPYRRQMLAVLFMHPDERFHVRQLARLTGVSAGSLHRELKAMASAGILQRESLGNQVLYQVNPNCPIHDELASIFRKTSGLAFIVRDALQELSDKISFAFVFGSMASGRQHIDSDIDICVLGEVELIDVVKAVKPLRHNLGREINPVVMSTPRFLQQLAAKERFAERLMDEPKVFAIGTDSELRKLIEDRTA